MIETITRLRRELHQNPELSGEEINTSLRLSSFLRDHGATVLTGIGGHGVMGILDFGASGPTVAIRCELDALPIAEANDFPHKSSNPGVSHKCGHDGHMAIVAGVLPWLKNENIRHGKVVLLFQPAEETGKGGQAVAEDSRFSSLKIDYVFALHNIPGFPLHTIITSSEYFSATVQSVMFRLHGKHSHASEPENGLNPALAIAEIINSFSVLNVPDVTEKDFALLTPVHLHLGQKAYGISAGEGEVHYTVRTWSEGAMNTLKERLLQIVDDIAAKHKLKYDTGWFDYFPASANDPTCNQMIERAALENQLNRYALPHAFKFGEDFGWYSKQYRSAMFGLGAGEQSPALHHADYDFPDKIIETGIKMFVSIIRRILTQEQRKRTD